MRGERADAIEVFRRPPTLFVLGWIVCAVLVALWPRLLVAGPPAGGEVGIEVFFGTFTGSTIGDNEEGLTPRDLSVTIEPGKDGGFAVGWTTIIRKAGGEKRKAYAIAFQPTQRPGIYSSAMRSNLFGERVPLDPFKGDPLVWARLRGRTLTVYALIILDDGGYDLQIYDRTLTPDGLDLHFSRTVNREPVTTLDATLVRDGN